MTILSSIKSALAIEDSIDDYDHDLINYINASIFKINTVVPSSYELGLVDDDTELKNIFYNTNTISDKDPVFNTILTIMILMVRNYFNPSKSSSVQKIYEDSINELLFSLMITLEQKVYKEKQGGE